VLVVSVIGIWFANFGPSAETGILQLTATVTR
jgi:hypothetical protein